MPVLDVMVVGEKRNIRTFALLDTGAGVTIFGTQHADALGIDWKKCPDIDLQGCRRAFQGVCRRREVGYPSGKLRLASEDCFLSRH